MAAVALGVAIWAGWGARGGVFAETLSTYEPVENEVAGQQRTTENKQTPASTSVMRLDNLNDFMRDVRYRVGETEFIGEGAECGVRITIPVGSTFPDYLKEYFGNFSLGRPIPMVDNQWVARLQNPDITTPDNLKKACESSTMLELFQDIQRNGGQISVEQEQEQENHYVKIVMPNSWSLPLEVNFSSVGLRRPTGVVVSGETSTSPQTYKVPFNQSELEKVRSAVAAVNASVTGKGEVKAP